ncbi:uncharacterized protein LOC124940554 [Impatiens glandulifera]|uniref:uncharacterized protein LOC124940554 n=1 Tax=Impatiens glandulifera TaxID=253017 RepID=UPI001FB1083B|nr:uncharacterized protein LOC124940554 [Impatiens glandulifera]
MEFFNRSLYVVFLLFLLFVIPCSFSSEKVVDEGLIYDIDYRGPETHSSQLPPPYQSGGWPYHHGKINVHRGTLSHHKSREGQVVTSGEKVLG